MRRHSSSQLEHGLVQTKVLKLRTSDVVIGKNGSPRIKDVWLLADVSASCQRKRPF